MSAPIPNSAFQSGALTTAPVKRERPWSEDELAYVADNLRRGYSYGQIANGLGRSRSAVASAIRRMRGHTDKPRVAPAANSADANKLGKFRQMNRVADLLAEGFTLTEIAEELGLTYNAVKCVFKRIKARLGPQAV